VPRLKLEDLFATLGDTLLIELIDIDGILHVLTAADRKLHLHTVGRTPDRAVDLARFLLRRLAYGGGGAGERESMVDDVGRRLEASLLGPAAAELGIARSWWCHRGGSMPFPGRFCRRCAPASSAWRRPRRHGCVRPGRGRPDAGTSQAGDDPVSVATGLAFTAFGI
jgi:hypothetical protein